MLLIGSSYSHSTFSCFLAHFTQTHACTDFMVTWLEQQLRGQPQLYSEAESYWYSSGSRRVFRKTLKQSHFITCADNPVVSLYVAASWMWFKLHNQLLIRQTPGVLSFISSCGFSRTTNLSSLWLLWSLSRTASQHVLFLSLIISFFITYIGTYRTFSH